MRSSTITIISSGLLRACLTAATVGGGSRIRTWSAWAPLRPSATPNSTRCPCRSAVVPEGSADECTKTSPPSSRARKPYPLSESYHLTLPVGTRRPHDERTELATTSDQVTDRMLWALPRLSVRDAGPQLRYYRSLGRAPLRAPGRPRPVGYPALRPGNITPNGPGKPRAVRLAVDFLNQKSMSPPPPGMAGAFSFSGFSAITASVVRNRPAIEAAFCSAERVTFAGSMIPALNMSTYLPSAAFRP